jgi:hypothetical protein
MLVLQPEPHISLKASEVCELCSSQSFFFFLPSEFSVFYSHITTKHIIPIIVNLPLKLRPNKITHMYINQGTITFLRLPKIKQHTYQKLINHNQLRYVQGESGGFKIGILLANTLKH